MDIQFGVFLSFFFSPCFFLEGLWEKTHPYRAPGAVFLGEAEARTGPGTAGTDLPLQSDIRATYPPASCVRLCLLTPCALVPSHACPASLHIYKIYPVSSPTQVLPCPLLSDNKTAVCLLTDYLPIQCTRPMFQAFPPYFRPE